MTPEDIDLIWAKCLNDAVEAGEPYTRHRFAAAIRAATKEEDAKICDLPWNGDADTYEYSNACNECAEAIRASK